MPQHIRENLGFGLLSVWPWSFLLGASVSPVGMGETRQRTSDSTTDEQKLQLMVSFSKFVDYVRFSTYNQSGRLWQFSLFVHEKQYLWLIPYPDASYLHNPIDMEADCPHLWYILSAKSIQLEPLDTGRDPRFAHYLAYGFYQFWRSSFQLKKNCLKSGYTPYLCRPESCEESDKLKLVLDIPSTFYSELSHC